MITGELKSKVDKLWETFWSNGISNPISVIEQISYLLFIKRLDDLELTKEKKAQRLNRPVKDPIFSSKDDPRRWSYFKNLDNPEEKLQAVRDRAFPFIKNLKGEAGDSTYQLSCTNLSLKLHEGFIRKSELHTVYNKLRYGLPQSTDFSASGGVGSRGAPESGDSDYNLPSSRRSNKEFTDV
jgi:hypothetical protein